MVDLSTSVVAHGKVRVLEDAGKPVPEEWVRDGLLQPLGGAKGFALALVVEALAGVVSGAGASSASPGPDDQGVFMLAFDPARFGPPAELAERLDAMLAYVLAAPLEPGAEALRAPGRRCRRCRSTRTPASSSRRHSSSASPCWPASSAWRACARGPKRRKRLSGSSYEKQRAIEPPSTIRLVPLT